MPLGETCQAWHRKKQQGQWLSWVAALLSATTHRHLRTRAQGCLSSQCFKRTQIPVFLCEIY